MKLVAKGWQSPWGLAFIDEYRIILTEKSGSIFLYNLQSKDKQKLYQVEGLYTQGQGGLLDVAIHQLDEQTWAYFTYSKVTNSATEKGTATSLARAKLHIQGQKIRLSDWQELLTSDFINDKNRHFGSRITFDDKGHVFFSIGDRGQRDSSQDLQSLAGVIIRLRLDGSIPKDNPFITTPQAHDEIYSHGHRNPQGLFFDVQQQQLYSSEHGPRGGDEINLITKGANYGWPIVSHGKEYWGPFAVGEATEKEGYESAKVVFTPSIAPSSLIIYQGQDFPKWQGSLLSSSLAYTYIDRVKLDENFQVIEQEKLFENFNQRIRALRESPEGKLFFITDNGNLYQITP